jgi:hypothetical protein
VRHVRDVSLDEVYFFWLRSEQRLHPNLDQGLVASFDPGDQTAIVKRKALLRSVRGAILDRLPPGPTCQEVLVDESDLPNVYLITCFDWFADTGGTFRLLDTLDHLAPGRTYDFGRGIEHIEHYRKVEDSMDFLARENPELVDEYLVLIATDPVGPFTIIDGTHRATALLHMHQSQPTLPWKAFLMLAPDMATCTWHIEASAMPSKVRELQELTRQGRLSR